MASVIFVNRYFYPDLSATSQMLSDLAFILAARGFKVRILTSRMEYQTLDTVLPGHETINGVEIFRVWTTRFGRRSLPGRAMDYASFYLSALITLLQLVKARDIIVAKTDPPLISIVAAIVATLKGARLINWLQDVFPEVALRLGVVKDGHAYRALRRLRNWSLRKAHRNVVLGERMRSLIEAEGIEPGRIRVIHNWADGDAIHPVPRAENPLREAWKLQSNFVVGYSGNLGRAHEFDTILQAARLLNGDASIAFLFIGGGASSEKLKQAATALGLTNIQFRPYQPQEQLSQSLSVPDVHLVSLLPDLEGLIVPSKIYGILSAGRPALFIGDHEGEVATMLRSHGLGRTVAPGDGEGLASAIRELAASLPHAISLGENARQSFERHYSRAHSIAHWAQALEELN